MALQTFHPFPKLPNEMKIKVWKLFNKGSEGQIVIFHSGDATYDKTGEGSLKFFVTYTVPPSLHVDQLARSETKKMYQLVVPTIMKGSPIYFNPEVDTMAFMGTFSKELFRHFAFTDAGSRDWFEKELRKLIVVSNSPWIKCRSRGPSPWFFARNIFKLDKLELFVSQVVCGCSNHSNEAAHEPIRGFLNNGFTFRRSPHQPQIAPNSNAEAAQNAEAARVPKVLFMPWDEEKVLEEFSGNARVCSGLKNINRGWLTVQKIGPILQEYASEEKLPPRYLRPRPHRT